MHGVETITCHDNVVLSCIAPGSVYGVAKVVRTWRILVFCDASGTAVYLGSVRV